MVTANTIIGEILGILGVVADGETPSVADANTVLRSLNMMIDNWAGRRLMQTALVRLNFPLVAGKYVYTIGPGGDFNTAKPFKVTTAFYRDSNNNDFGLDVITREEYDSYEDKIITSGPPMKVFYDPGQTQQVTQIGTIYMYPIVDGNTTYTLFIEAMQPFTEFTTLTDQFTFPPAYQEAMIFNAAIRVAPKFGKQITKEIAAIALESYTTIANMNSVRILASIDIAKKMNNTPNIYSGEWMQP